MHALVVGADQGRTRGQGECNRRHETQSATLACIFVRHVALTTNWMSIPFGNRDSCSRATDSCVETRGERDSEG